MMSGYHGSRNFPQIVQKNPKKKERPGEGRGRSYGAVRKSSVAAHAGFGLGVFAGLFGLFHFFFLPGFGYFFQFEQVR